MTLPWELTYTIHGVLLVFQTVTVVWLLLIALPAPFANTNYRITYGCDWNADNLVRSGNTVAKMLTSFTARVQHNQGVSATNLEWIAIGRKP